MHHVNHEPEDGGADGDGPCEEQLQDDPGQLMLCSPSIN